ncbi:hypothetical protein GGX14DRAFT_566896 [Mycena pura]|uniref:Uncharacterized protein n=1 Tax=Mycena pura TaxID=153505 RepID=A0AAD6VG46_9AGAR|nr:hypothetical protein GGX14DRAFT_566896 [Mycena pura]
MVTFAFAFLAVFLAGLASAQSFPVDVHPNATMLGTDPGSNWTVAYDSNFKELERYYTPGGVDNSISVSELAEAAGKCRQLTETELKSLPAWGAMQSYANKNFGTGSYNLYFGDAGNQGGNTVAWMCVEDDIVQLQSTGNAQCTTNTLHTEGTLVGASGSVTISATSGSTSTASYTVTKQSTLGISYTATIEVGVPDVVGASGSWTASASFTNEESHSFSTEIKNEVQQSVTLKAPDGSTCVLDFDTKTCHEPVKGSVTFSATGWLTFGYNDPTNGHYYWYLSIDNFASDGIASSSEFTGSINANSKSHYAGKCTK